MTHVDIAASRGRRATRDRHVFLILLALYFLVLYPILRADRYYVDDMKRALVGRAGWDSNGRPLTTLLMKLLQCYDHALVDISPLTQFGAIALLAWIGVLIARRYAIRSPWMAALVAFPLGAQPFFLENLSYKFDALSMTLAIYLAMLPVLLLKHDRRGWWWGVLALFASLNFYQAAINVTLVFILLTFALGQLDNDTPARSRRRLAMPVLQVATALLLYQILVGIHISGWVSQHAAMVHDVRGLSRISDNVVAFFSFIGGSFNTQWWLYFGPVLGLLALLPVVIGVRRAIACRGRHPAWVVALLIAASLVLPVLAIACVAGPMLLLQEPLIRPRVLIGVGGVLAAGLILMQAWLARSRHSPRWGLAVAGMLALGMCVVASAYGNAAGAQRQYEDRIATTFADDVASLQAEAVIRSYLVIGTAGLSPVTRHVASEFPLINALVLPYLSADDVFDTYHFLRFHVPDLTDLRHEPDADAIQRTVAMQAQACRGSSLRTTRAYDLQLIGQTVVMVLRGEHDAGCPAQRRRAVTEARAGDRTPVVKDATPLKRRDIPSN